ncbi:unnamed protein product [Lathyrus oleraceus]
MENPHSKPSSPCDSSPPSLNHEFTQSPNQPTTTLQWRTTRNLHSNPSTTNNRQQSSLQTTTEIGRKESIKQKQAEVHGISRTSQRNLQKEVVGRKTRKEKRKHKDRKVVKHVLPCSCFAGGNESVVVIIIFISTQPSSRALLLRQHNGPIRTSIFNLHHDVDVTHFITNKLLRYDGEQLRYDAAFI